MPVLKHFQRPLPCIWIILLAFLKSDVAPHLVGDITQQRPILFFFLLQFGSYYWPRWLDEDHTEQSLRQCTVDTRHEEDTETHTDLLTRSKLTGPVRVNMKKK